MRGSREMTKWDDLLIPFDPKIPGHYRDMITELNGILQVCIMASFG